MKRAIVWTLPLVLFVTTAGSAHGAPPTALADAASPVVAAAPPKLSDPQRLAKLRHIHTTMLGLQRRLAKRRRAMAAATQATGKARIGREVAVLERRLEGARLSFEALAADTNIDTLLQDPRQTDRDLVAEVEELIGPVVDAFRRISARPRRIEQLRRQIGKLKARHRTAKAALVRLRALPRSSEPAPWRQRIRETETRLEGIVAELEIRLNAQERALKAELSADESWLDSLRGSTSAFLSTKGKNILFATLAFVLTLLLALGARRRLLEQRSQRMRWLRKSLGALYGGLAFALATIASLVTFYVLHDVLLFTVTLLALSLLAWSFRHLGPRYVSELRLVLNLGTVREGERVVWQGLPWRVDKLGLRSTLVNEELQGGPMHVAASELIGKHSREVVPGEPWFPTAVGDWVKLKDGLLGQVVVQTPEQVVVREVGFAPVTYATVAFLANRPQNLSGGFLTYFRVALDQRLMANLETEVIPALRAGLTEALAEQLSGDDPAMRWFSVDYDRADEGALLLIVQAELAGREAGRMFKRGRELRLAILQVCRREGWPIAQNRLFAETLQVGRAPDTGPRDGAL